MKFLINVLLLLAISSLIGFGVSFITVVIFKRKKLKEVIVMLLSLAVIGACAGIAGGLSRVGAVQTIIPAFLGLLGGLSVYLFGVKGSDNPIASFGAIALSIALISAYALGASERNTSEEYKEVRTYCATAYTDQKLLSDDLAFERFRDRFGTLCDRSMSSDPSSSPISPIFSWIKPSFIFFSDPPPH